MALAVAGVAWELPSHLAESNGSISAMSRESVCNTPGLCPLFFEGTLI